MEQRWITLKDGRRILINNYMNQKIRNMSTVKAISNQNKIEASHITKAENVKPIQQSGFDLEKSGSGAGNTFGKGVYFSTEPNEIEYWKWRIDHSKEIKADIDTTGFLEVQYNDYTSGKNFMDPIIDNFTDNQKVQYKQLLKQYKQDNKIAEQLSNIGDPNYKNYWHINEKQDAVNKILEDNYPGLVVKQSTPKIDIITGGNQIVVYDTSRIRIK